jgi:hypothetical protein
MIEGLIFARTNLGGYRLIPFFGIVEFRIDVEDDASKRKNPMTNDLADLEFRGARFAHQKT